MVGTDTTEERGDGGGAVENGSIRISTHQEDKKEEEPSFNSVCVCVGV